MTLQTFAKLTHTAFAKTPDGKSRQKTFYQTINPYNRTAGGCQKTREDIKRELVEEGKQWKAKIEAGE